MNQRQTFPLDDNISTDEIIKRFKLALSAWDIEVTIETDECFDAYVHLDCEMKE